MLERGDQLMTSAITLGEILVKPIQNGDAKAVAYYQKLIATTAAVIPFEEKAALAWARLRADRSLRPPDTTGVCSSSENRSLHHQRCAAAFEADSGHPVHRSA